MAMRMFLTAFREMCSLSRMRVTALHLWRRQGYSSLANSGTQRGREAVVCSGLHWWHCCVATIGSAYRVVIEHSRRCAGGHRWHVPVQAVPDCDSEWHTAGTDHGVSPGLAN